MSAGAKGDEHRLMLVAHHCPHRLGHPLVAKVLPILLSQGVHDAPAVGEQVSGDMRAPHAGVLRLNVEQKAAVTNVIVVALLGGRRTRIGHDGNGITERSGSHRRKRARSCHRRRSRAHRVRADSATEEVLALSAYAPRGLIQTAHSL